MLCASVIIKFCRRDESIHAHFQEQHVILSRMVADIGQFNLFSLYGDDSGSFLSANKEYHFAVAGCTGKIGKVLYLCQLSAA